MSKNHESLTPVVRRLDEPRQLALQAYSRRSSAKRLHALLETAKDEIDFEAWDPDDLLLVSLLCTSNSKQEFNLTSRQIEMYDQATEALNDPTRVDEPANVYKPLTPSDLITNRNDLDSAIDDLGDQSVVLSVHEHEIRSFAKDENPNLNGILNGYLWPPLDQLTPGVREYSESWRAVSAWLDNLYFNNPEGDAHYIGPIPSQSLDELTGFVSYCIPRMRHRLTDRDLILLELVLSSGSPSSVSKGDIETITSSDLAKDNGVRVSLLTWVLARLARATDDTLVGVGGDDEEAPESEPVDSALKISSTLLQIASWYSTNVNASSRASPNFERFALFRSEKILPDLNEIVFRFASNKEFEYKTEEIEPEDGARLTLLIGVFKCLETVAEHTFRRSTEGPQFTPQRNNVDTHFVGNFLQHIEQRRNNEEQRGHPLRRKFPTAYRAIFRLF